ncbi:precorrin-8X methylmutase [Clostridiaceae bacterium M8S5]|nr:precorrin-8X methylmutase [Clostridiaceae bacterium M8S5]
MNNFEVNPHAIESKSMEIIESIMEDVDSFSSEQLSIVKRVIHTTADFEYSKLIKFNGDVIEKCKKALESGCAIYADTHMIKVGINRTNVAKYNCKVCNYVHDEDVKKIAKERNITRSMTAIEKAYHDKNIKIFVIGNAPTALYKLMELIEENHQESVPIIIGVPVGFVGAAESKDELMKRTNISSIVIKGRKGGSTVAVSIINAILKMCKGK